MSADPFTHPSPSDDSLQEFLEGLREDEMTEEIVRTGEFTRPEVARRLRSYLGEARFGLRCIRDFLVAHRGARVLEVGSGIGLLSRFLDHCGFDIQPLEPVGQGFGVVGAIATALDSRLPPPSRPVWGISVEDLNPDVHGRFDFIFSINVLEHCPSVARALVAVESVLGPQGKMLHACPNYRFPYEPHFSLPVLACCPGLTRSLFRKKTEARKELWDSLNFVTSGEVNRIARSLGLRTSFRPGVFRDSLDRLSRDKEFARRHSSPTLDRIFALVRASGLQNLSSHVPATWATPMIVSLSRKEVR